MIWMGADFNPHLSIRVSTLLPRRTQTEYFGPLHADESHELLATTSIWMEVRVSQELIGMSLYLIHTYIH